MPNFKLEIREAYEKKYLKVFLKDLALLPLIKGLLEKLSSVKNVNITDNTKPDLTVYPSKLSDIDETYSEVNRSLNEHFHESRRPKIGFRLKEKSDQPYANKTSFDIRLGSNRNEIEEKTWWKKYHNHVYGGFTILGVVLSIIFFAYPRNDTNLPFFNDTYSVNNENWINSDTFDLYMDSKFPILDKNIYVGRSISELIVGGVNSSLLKIACKTEKGEALSVTYDSLKQEIMISFIGNKYIELEYKGFLYSLQQVLTDWEMDNDLSKTYFRYEIYLKPLTETSMQLQKANEY